MTCASSTMARWAPTVSLERWVAGATVTVGGVGSMLLIAGGASSKLDVMLLGGGVLAGALMVLLAGGWIDNTALLLIALPLPALYDSPSARIAPALLVTAVVIGGWILRRGTDATPVRLGSFPRRPTALLFGAVLVSAAFAAERLTAVREIVNFTLLLGVLVIFTEEFRRDRAKAALVPPLIAAVSGIGGLIALSQSFGIFPTPFVISGTSFFRATLGFDWANEAGIFFAVSLPFTVHVLRNSRTVPGSALGGLAAVGCLIGLLATYSRGSWLAVLFAPFAIVLMGDRKAALRFWLLVAGAAVVLNLLIGGLVYDRLYSLIGDWVVEQRGALMLAGLLMFQAHPIVGVGPGGFGAALQEVGPQIPWLYDYTGSAHNAYIHSAAELGILGVTAFVTFFAGTLARLVRSARQSRAAGLADEPLKATAVWAFATACLVSFVEWPLAHGPGQLIMVVAALGLALDRGVDPAAASASSASSASSALPASHVGGRVGAVTITALTAR